MERVKGFKNYSNCPLGECPYVKGRICTAYKSGKTRLIFDPLSNPEGQRLYTGGRERLHSVEECVQEIRVTASFRQAFLLESYV